MLVHITGRSYDEALSLKQRQRDDGTELSAGLDVARQTRCWMAGKDEPYSSDYGDSSARSDASEAEGCISQQDLKDLASRK